MEGRRGRGHSSPGFFLGCIQSLYAAAAAAAHAVSLPAKEGGGGLCIEIAPRADCGETRKAATRPPKRRRRRKRRGIKRKRQRERERRGGPQDARVEGNARGKCNPGRGRLCQRAADCSSRISVRACVRLSRSVVCLAFSEGIRCLKTLEEQSLIHRSLSAVANF